MAITLVITGAAPLPSINWYTGITARGVLEATYNALIPTPPGPVTSFSYGLEFYGAAPVDPLGYLVCMINGTSDSANAALAPYFFWEFLIDDVEQETGIDYTLVPDGATVTFTYTEYIPEVTKSKTLNAKYQRRLLFVR